MLSPSSKFQRRVKNKKEKRKCWLFHAKDFQSLMYPCFIFCRIFGIFPYNINASIFETSRSRYILLTIITCIICVSELASLYEINILRPKTKVGRQIQENCFYMLGGFIVIVSFVLSSPRMRLLQTILDISSKLPPKSYEKLSKLIHVKDIFGFLLLISQTSISLLDFYQQDNFRWFLTIQYYVSFQIFQLNMLYMNCVCVLKACFKRIDNNLMNLRMLVINDKSHIPRLIYYQQRNPFLLEEIKILKKQYLMVSNTVQMLNIIFSPQLLATIAIVFIEITFEIYFNTVQWKNGLSINMLKQIRDSCLMSYMTYYLANVTLMIWACETGKNQAIKISTTVHDVLNSTNDEQIKDELHLFSLQILHCDNTFSAKGLTVDATLFTMMVGTITTYVLILIQFLITSHSCDTKIAIHVVESI